MTKRVEEISGSLQLELGSFRDRKSRVFYDDNQVFRALSEEALQDWELLCRTRFFQEMVAEGKIVRTSRLENRRAPHDLLGKEASAVIEHQAIPLISYPYEWSFGMLKDAALLHLEILRRALDEDMTLKDASAYNVQWQGLSPIFIDIASFERLAPGEPWVGYRQFCQMFLYPLFLQAHKGLPFQFLLRGSLEGLEAGHFCGLLSLPDFLRPGVFVHGYLQAKFQAQFTKSLSNRSSDGINLSSGLMSAGYNKAAIQTMVSRLEKMILGLKWQESSVWGEYAENNSYNSVEVEEKTGFVREAILSLPALKQVWDVGANTGVYSRIAAEHATQVIALDSDHVAIDKLYQSLKADPKHQNILPLVYNMADPSPGLGWRGQERKPLENRSAPDLILCLAVIHHLVIHHNIPMDELIRWLAGFHCPLVIEFVSKDDPMVKTLLSAKADQYWDYDQDYFEQAASRDMEIRKKHLLSQGTRTLYLLTPRND